MKNQSEFTIELGLPFFQLGDVLQNGEHKRRAVITSKPITHNDKWYHRVIRYITFNTCYKKYYSYTLKLLN
jgi:hypothetical protein